MCAVSPHWLCTARGLQHYRSVCALPRWVWENSEHSCLWLHVHCWLMWDLGNLWQLRNGKCWIRGMAWLGGKSSPETLGLCFSHHWIAFTLASHRAFPVLPSLVCQTYKYLIRGSFIPFQAWKLSYRLCRASQPSVNGTVTQASTPQGTRGWEEQTPSVSELVGQNVKFERTILWGKTDVLIKHMKRCPASSAIREMQIRTTTNYYLLHIKMAMKEKTQ